MEADEDKEDIFVRERQNTDDSQEFENTVYENVFTKAVTHE